MKRSSRSPGPATTTPNPLVWADREADIIAPKIHQTLNAAGIEYELVEHPPTASSIASAGASHIPSGQIAKAILLETPGDYRLAVLPAHLRVDLAELRDEFGQAHRLAQEEELNIVFNDCAVGAVPPLGNSCGVTTIVDDSLADQPDIYFEAGDHLSLVHVSQADWPGTAWELQRPMAR